MAKPNLGSMIDALHAARADRIETQKAMDDRLKKMKDHEAKLREDIIALLERSGLDKGSGSEATASITVKLLPRVTDWPSVYRYIKKNDAFDLLERRIARLAFQSRLEVNEHVPGVDVFEEKDLSITKR